MRKLTELDGFVRACRELPITWKYRAGTIDPGTAYLGGTIEGLIAEGEVAELRARASFSNLVWRR